MKIIITGTYAIGSHLTKLLARNNEDITLIDNDEERLDKIANELDVLTIHAEPNDIAKMKEAGTDKADLYIAVTPDENTNITCCAMAKALGAKRTVAKVDHAEFLQDDEMQSVFTKIGIDSLIYPEMLAAKDIINGLKMSWVRQRWDVHNGALVMLGIKLREECTILDKPLKDLCGPDDPYHVVAIKRGNDTIIPGGNDCLKLDDIAYFMTMKQYIPYIRTIVGKERYVDVQNVMIMGGGNTAVRAVKTLPEYMRAKVFETNEERCEELNELIDDDRIMVIHGDGRDIDLLTEEGIGSTQAFVALTTNAETNILACLTAKRLGIRKTVAMVENMDYVSMAESLDIGTIINKKAIAASHIYQMLLDDNVSNVRFLTMANANVAEFVAQKGSKVTKKKVFELGLPKGVTLGGLVRKGKGILISGSTQIEADDSVMVFCLETNMKKIEQLFN